MSIEHTELFDSREAQLEPGKNSVDLRYRVWGSEDDVEISEYMTALLETDYLGIPFTSLRLSPEGNGIWMAVASYSSEVSRKIGDNIDSFESTTGTTHIEQSIITAYSAKADGVTDDPPDLKGLIGVNGDRIEGADILTGTFSFSVTRYFEDADITNEYWMNIADMTPSVNTNVFRGFQPGEVLFLGATGSQRANLEWEITFRFSVSRNVDDYVVTGFSENPIAKDGWDYLWLKFFDQKENNNKIKRPKYLYIERVYNRYNFDLLGIGS